MADKIVRISDDTYFEQDDTVGQDSSSHRNFITALARGFEVLRAFKPGAGPMGNLELSRATGIPKATVTRLTHTLSELGYLRHLKDQAKYEPTESILALGYSVLSNMLVRQIAHDPMQELALQHKVTVALASRDRLSMIFVDVCNASSLTALHLEIGSRVPMPTTAAGRAYLAGVSDNERDFFYNCFEERFEPEAWASLRPKVDEARAQIKDRGYCYVEDEWHQGTRAVGVPLMSANGQQLKSMICGGPAFAVDRDKLERELGPRLAHLSRSLAPMLR